MMRIFLKFVDIYEKLKKIMKSKANPKMRIYVLS